MNSTQEEANIVHLAEGFFLQEREDGTFALIEDDEVVAEGDSFDEALEALQVSLDVFNYTNSHENCQEDERCL